jgi:hypothetical protein
MIRMDVYRHLDEQPSTPDELASSLDLAPRGAAALLRSLERGGRANHRLLVLHLRHKTVESGTVKVVPR